MIILKGVLMGLTLALVFGFGPGFFSLIQTSINRGFKSALLLDLGIVLNDVMIVALMLMSSIQVHLNNDKRIVYAGISAGIILIIFGIFTYNLSPSNIVKRSESTNESINELEKKYKSPKWYIYVGKGFVMNIFNPFVWIFWMTCVATASGQYNGNIYCLVKFFIGVFGTVIIFDILKAAGAYSLKKFFTEKMMTVLNKIIGLIIGLCGIVLIIKVLFF